MPDAIVTCLQSIPLLPINLHAAKLWVEIDGRDISKINRSAADTRHSGSINNISQQTLQKLVCELDA